MPTAPETSIEKYLDNEDVQNVFLEFCDLNGISRSKQVTADHFRKTWQSGFPINMLVLVQTPRNHIPNGTGYGEEIGYGDGMLRPDPTTFKALPWREGAARVLCEVEYENERVGGEPRGVLQSVLDSVELDLDFSIGSELEFYLLEGDSVGFEPVTDHKHEWISWATEQVNPFYDRLTEWGPEYGIPIQSIEHEHGPGQFEVLFDYGPPITTADTTFDFKRLVKRTAQRSGHKATFMAKPLDGESASGYHLHVSAERDGKNAFADGDGGLSDDGRHFVGGILAHSDALTAFHAPTLNSFKRFRPGGFAPYTASWGYDNRTTAIRIPSGTPRIENRIASADANPYLVIASTLVAGVDGINKSIDPGDAIEGSSGARGHELPRSLELSLAALESDEVLREGLGDDLVRAYVANKCRGIEEFRNVVTEWERNQYVDVL